jgi:D-tyrosyl-tRNA(Tyr) deacylase
VIALLQRVNWARVTIEGQTRAQIDKGLLVLVGLEKDDDEEKADRLLHKLLNYRVFADGEGRMNLSLLDIKADLLLVSQFTLAATTDKGLRPGFSSAMPPELAQPLYHYLVAQAGKRDFHLGTGEFGADMKVALENDGPVTFTLRV